MPDDVRSQQIAERIDKTVTSGISIEPSNAGTSISPRNMTELMEFTKLMSLSGTCIRKQFRNNPGACLAITMQAMRWNADPFAVANKTYEVNDQLAYEAQLVHAIVNSRAPLMGRLEHSYSGEGPTRRCKITGWLRGENRPSEYETPLFRDINPKNSPLWKNDPDQQLGYYAERAWARRHVPEVLLGIYTPDELPEPIDVTPTPRPKREDYPEPPEAAAEPYPPEPETWTVTWSDGELQEIKIPDHAADMISEQLTEALTLARAEAIWIDNAAMIETLPGRLGEALGEEYEATIAKFKQGPNGASVPPAIVEPLSEPVAEVENPVIPADTPAVGSAPLPEAPERQSFEIAMVQKNGKPDLRTWAIALLLPKARQQKTLADLAFLYGDNSVHTAAYLETLSPPAKIAFKKELDDIKAALAAKEVRG